jgi:pyruvate,orthophosphate dikinase
LPITIRLLDLPLNEFLPHTEEDISKVAEKAEASIATIKQRLEKFIEINPMLGHRGCRLGVTYPEIYEMQTRAIFEAVAEVLKAGKSARPEIMIPLVSIKSELTVIKDLIDAVAREVGSENGMDFDYLIGVMIELPRAAIRADEIAEKAEFFSFGTNGLTQTTFGLSQGDTGSFLEDYHQKNMLLKDPFISIDQDGVGELMRLGLERGRKVRPDLKIGICGDHGADPDSINFCQDIGLDYVSCSPYRVPIARLAAAQAAIKELKLCRP